MVKWDARWLSGTQGTAGRRARWSRHVAGCEGGKQRALGSKACWQARRTGEESGGRKQRLVWERTGVYRALQHQYHVRRKGKSMLRASSTCSALVWGTYGRAWGRMGGHRDAWEGMGTHGRVWGRMGGHGDAWEGMG
eukprot:356367-Chlamydomonas_euryale.AAC.1